MNSITYADARRFSFDLYMFEEPSPAVLTELDDLGVGVFVGPRLLGSIGQIALSASSLTRTIHENGPYDVVHSHILAANAITMLSARLASVPIRVSHIHGMIRADYRSAIRRTYLAVASWMTRCFATHYCACSRAAGEDWYGKRFFDTHGEVLANGIDVGRFMSVDSRELARLRQELQIDDGCLVIGNIGRFVESKNHRFLVDVFRVLQAQVPHSVLLLGGPDKSTLEELRLQVAKYDLEDSVRILGPRDDLPCLLHLIDVFVFPSKSEGLGIVVLEAQAAGTAVIASSAVPRETDMGLGLVQFLDLELSAQAWASAIIDSVGRVDVTERRRREAFDRSGYSVTGSAYRLQEIYSTERGRF